MKDSCGFIFSNRRWARFFGQVFTGLLLAGRAGDGSAATFTVTDTTDLATSASLRRAINDANANPGPDTIVFQFPTSSYPVTLNLSSALPPITEGVVIDATDGGS